MKLKAGMCASVAFYHVSRRQSLSHMDRASISIITCPSLTSFRSTVKIPSVIMKLATPLVALFLATQSAASFFGQRIEVDNSLSVPGDNPLQYCQAADDNILAIEYVNLSPNPPVPYVS